MPKDKRGDLRDPLTQFTIRRAGMTTGVTPTSLMPFWQSQGWRIKPAHSTGRGGGGRLESNVSRPKNMRAWERLINHNRALEDWLHSDKGLRAPRYWPAAVDEEWRVYGVTLSPLDFCYGCFPKVSRPERKYGRMAGVPELTALAHGFDLEDEELELAVEGVRNLCEDIPFVVYACRPDFRGVALPYTGDSLMSRVVQREEFLRDPMGRSGRQWRQALNPRLWTAHKLRELPRLPWVPCSTYTPLERTLVTSGVKGWYRASTPELTY